VDDSPIAEALREARLALDKVGLTGAMIEVTLLRTHLEKAQREEPVARAMIEHATNYKLPRIGVELVAVVHGVRISVRAA
jgi:hypothetical protein